MEVYNMHFFKSDYEQAKSSLTDALASLNNDMKNISLNIKNYHTGAKNILSGEAYTIILNRIKTYSDAYNFFSNAIDVVLNNIISSNNSVINAMGSYSEISGEKLQEIESEIIRQKNLYSSIENQAKESNTEQIKNTTDYNYTQTIELQKSKKEIEETLINIKNADNNGANCLNDIGNTIINFENCFITK